MADFDAVNAALCSSNYNADVWTHSGSDIFADGAAINYPDCCADIRANIYAVAISDGYSDAHANG